MMIRFALVLAVMLTTTSAVMAEAAQEEAKVEVAPVDPVKKKADDIDRLLGDLHKTGVSNPQATIEKIWTLWSVNDSPMAEVLLTQSSKALQDGAFEIGLRIVIALHVVIEFCA